MASTKILIIDDEQDVIDLLSLHLRKAGYALSTATDGATGLRLSREETPALIILDLMLPKMPGLEICKVLKTDPATRTIPVLMLTAKAEEIDRIVGLEFGADDYVTKPFSPRELVLRVNAILRRGKSDGAEDRKLSIGTITLDPARHQVDVAGRAVRLTSVEFKLLSMLMRRQRRVQERDRLLNEVWGYESVIDTPTVDTHVGQLRQKLGKAANATAAGRGVCWRI